MVPFGNFKQYPRVPNVIEPLRSVPTTGMATFRKKMGSKNGTQNDTRPRSAAEIRVIRKPGVAGPMQPIIANEMRVGRS